MSNLFACIDLDTLAAAAAFASTEQTRFYLAGVRVEIEPRAVRYIATDGHTMIVRRVELTDADIPDNTLLGAITIPTAACKAIKLRASARDRRAALAHVGGRTFQLAPLAKDTTGATFESVDGTYPVWSMVVPKGELEKSAAPVQFNPELLARFPVFAKRCRVGAMARLDNGGGPAVVMFSGAAETFGLIMPMRGPAGVEWNGRPEWTGRTPQACPELVRALEAAA